MLLDNNIIYIKLYLYKNTEQLIIYITFANISRKYPNSLTTIQVKSKLI